MADVGKISDDGNWRWDGAEWQPNEGEEIAVAHSATTFDTEPQMSTNDDIGDIMMETLERKEQEDRPDKLMQIMTVLILIFASCTAFISQQVSSIEAEASEYEASAELKLADARATESSENQLLIREEILLTEAQNLALELSGYDEKIKTQEEKINSSITKFLKPEIEYQLLIFMMQGWIPTSEYSDILPLSYCLYEINTECEISKGEYNFIMAYTLNSVQDEEESFLDQGVRILADIVNYSSYPFPIVDFDELNETYLFSIPVNNIQESYAVMGVESLLYETSERIDELEFNSITNSTQSQYINRELDVLYANWQNTVQKSQHHLLLAESLYIQEDYDGYWLNVNLSTNYHTESLELVESINLNNIKSANVNSNETLLRQLISNAQNDYNFIEKEIERMESRMDIVQSESNTELNKIETAIYASVELELLEESASGLKENILGRSAAYQNGSVSEETGLFLSDEVQQNFNELVHTASEEKYESAEEDQKEAREMQDKLSSVSSSVLFISVANMLLGIAGGFAMKKEKKRNALILLCVGGLAGVFGAIQIVPTL